MEFYRIEKLDKTNKIDEFDKQNRFIEARDAMLAVKKNPSLIFQNILRESYHLNSQCALFALYNDHPEKSDYEVMVKNPELQVR